jgi:hypothetical protein
MIKYPRRRTKLKSSIIRFDFDAGQDSARDAGYQGAETGEYRSGFMKLTPSRRFMVGRENPPHRGNPF